jgi:TonB family protein
MLMSLIAALRRALRHGATHLGHGCTQAFLITWSATALAQTPPSPAASTPIADHVKRAAERPYYWIKLNAQAPEPPAQRPKSANRPAARTPPTTPDGAAPNSPLTTRVSGITERVTPIIDSPALATSDPVPTERIQSLNAVLESAPPAAGQNPPVPAEPTTDAAPAAADPGTPPAPAAESGTTSRRAEPSLAAAATTSLKLLSQVEPDFPGALQRRLRKGSVEVSFTVLPDGSVSSPSVLRSSHPRLEAPALGAVAQWRFAPMAAPKPGVVEVGFNLDP